MGEQWPWTKAVYTVQTQLWAAAHWLILRCVWERRGTPFSSFVLVSVNSVVGGKAHCGGQCFVLTQGLAQLVPRVQPEDSWIMERGSWGPRGVFKSDLAHYNPVMRFAKPAGKTEVTAHHVDCVLCCKTSAASVNEIHHIASTSNEKKNLFKTAFIISLGLSVHQSTAAVLLPLTRAFYGVKMKFTSQKNMCHLIKNWRGQ